MGLEPGLWAVDDIHERSSFSFLSKGRDGVLTDWVQCATQHNTAEQKQDRHGKISYALRLLIFLQKTNLISVRLSIYFDGDTFEMLSSYFSGAITAKYTSKNVFL